MYIWKLARNFTIVALSLFSVREGAAESCREETFFDDSSLLFCGPGIETYAFTRVPPIAPAKELYVVAQTCGNHYNFVWAQGLNQFGNPIASCIASVFDVECGEGAATKSGCNSAVDMFIEADWDSL